MAFDFRKPLHTLSFVEENKKDQALWEEESLGGITEDNNRLPVPVVWLLLLTVLTAFAITFPLWGQRPNAAIYAEYIRLMNTPEIMAMQDDKAAMARIVQMSKGVHNDKHQIEARAKGGVEAPHVGESLEAEMDYDALRARHPVSMDDLRIIKPQIQALMAKGSDLEEYTVVGDRVVIANFEGNYKADGARERKQPWWDKGYTIDIFYVIMFFIGVTMVIKCLPPYSWQPTHKKDH
jgi:hypothetical protein